MSKIVTHPTCEVRFSALCFGDFYKKYNIQPIHTVAVSRINMNIYFMFILCNFHYDKKLFIFVTIYAAKITGLVRICHTSPGVVLPPKFP